MRRLDLRRFIQRPHSTGACCRGMRCHASVHKYVLASMCDKSDRMSSKFLDETRCHSICRIMIGRVGPIQWCNVVLRQEYSRFFAIQFRIVFAFLSSRILFTSFISAFLKQDVYTELTYFEFCVL
ncbi:uncharacterized protein [Physcomitrium patens]